MEDTNIAAAYRQLWDKEIADITKMQNEVIDLGRGITEAKNLIEELSDKSDDLTRAIAAKQNLCRSYEKMVNIYFAED